MIKTKRKVPVTVIVLAYKRLKYVMDAINSVLSNTVIPDQIIFSKCTENPIIDAKLKNIGVDVLTFGDNLSYGEVLINSLMKAKFDIVSILEDDDIFLPGKIEEIYSNFLSDKSVIFIKDQKTVFRNNNIDFDLRQHSNQFLTLRNTRNSDFILPIKKFDNIIELFKLEFNVNPSTMSFRKDFLLENRDVVLCSDPLDVVLGSLAIESRSGKMRILRSSYTGYRVHETNDSIITSRTDAEIRRIKLTWNKYLNGLLRLSRVLSDNSFCSIYVDLYIYNQYMVLLEFNPQNVRNIIKLGWKIIMFAYSNSEKKFSVLLYTLKRLFYPVVQRMLIWKA